MRLIDADAYSAEMKQRQEACKEWISGLTDSELQNQAIGTLNAFIEAKLTLNSMPTVDAVPVRHGKWIVWDEVIAGIYHTVSECSECGFTTDKMFREEMPHCPNCGARMDEE